MLRSRRRIATQPPAWALSPKGLHTLRRAGPGPSGGHDGAAGDRESGAVDADPRRGGEGDGTADTNGLDAEFAAIDAVLARSAAAIEKAKRPSQAASSRAADTKALVYDLDWDEDARLQEWRDVVRSAQELPPVLSVIVSLDAWNEPAVSQHPPWLGRLLAAATLRQTGVTSGAHLVAINLGLKTRFRAWGLI